MASPESFAWDEALGFLMGVLGWSPEQAWGATLPELRLAAEGRHGKAQSREAIRHAALAGLIAAFPDMTNDDAVSG
jgi:hypothetical protein